VAELKDRVFEQAVHSLRCVAHATDRHSARAHHAQQTHGHTASHLASQRLTTSPLNLVPNDRLLKFPGLNTITNEISETKLRNFLLRGHATPASLALCSGLSWSDVATAATAPSISVAVSYLSALSNLSARATTLTR